MDALAGYGSSGSDSEDAAPAAPRAAARPHVALPPPVAAAPGGKRVVQFKVPLRVDALDADDEEEARAAKRRREAPAAPTGGGSGLFAFLPKPIHNELGAGGDGLGGGGKLDLGGGGDAPARAAPRPQPAPAAPRRVDAAPPAPAMHPSMMFMVQPGSNSTLAETVGWAVEADEHQQLSAAALAGGAEGPDAMLFHALEAERAAAARRNPRGGPALQAPAVLEVSAAQLTAGRDKLVATKTLTGMAFGPEYEAKLRAEAGLKPSDSARRKHQIGSLLHDAKMREIEMLEGRLTAMKTKRETQARYGW